MTNSAKRDSMRGAAHILFHQPHIIAGLQVEAASVERHALADQSELRVFFISPAQLHDPRRFRTLRVQPHEPSGSSASSKASPIMV